MPKTYDIRNLAIGKSDTEFVSTVDDSKPIIMMSSRHPSAPMLQGYNLDGIHFDNVCLDGNFSNQPGQVRGSSSQVLCWLRNGEDVKMQNCIMRNSAIDGLKLTAYDDILFENNVISDLGHEGLYAMYGCEGGIVRNNTCKTRTNSFCRLSYGATDFKISDNTIYSEIAGWSTGPGIEVDKGQLKNIEIYKNTIKNLNGSGIWFSADVAGCSNVNIHDNLFSNVGNFLNGSGKYNGYSNAGIAGAGMSGMIIEDNIFENIKVGYAVMMAEAKHAVPGSYKWIFRNNTVRNCKYGFRVSNARGYISGSGNKFSGIGTMEAGVLENINVTAAESTTGETTQPIENTTTDSKEVVKIDLQVTDYLGRTGKTSIEAITTPVKARTVQTTQCTLKMSALGLYGASTYELPQVTTLKPTGGNFLIDLKLTRANGSIVTSSFILPTVKGTGANVFKFRTPDGRYGEIPFSITLTEAIVEPTTGIKKMKFTVIAKTDKGELVHTTKTEETLTTQTLQEGSEIDGTVKFLTDNGLKGEISGKIKLTKQ